MSATPWHRARRLRGGCTYVAFRPATRAVEVLKEPRVWQQLLDASDRAFGRDTSAVWQRRLEGGFFARVDRFCLLLDGRHEVIGWTAARAATVSGRRCVYFDSTGITPEYQGRRLIPLVQQRLLLYELLRHPLRPAVMAIRTRSPVAYRMFLRSFGAERVIPPLDGEVDKAQRRFIEAMAVWLDEHGFDPATARIDHAYCDRHAVYGAQSEPRTGDVAIDSLFDRLEPDAALLVAGQTSLSQVLRRLPSGARPR